MFGDQLQTQANIHLSPFRHSYNAILSLGDHVWTVTSLEKLADGVQPQISVEELIACEQVVRKDKYVQELAAKVGE